MKAPLVALLTAAAAASGQPVTLLVHDYSGLSGSVLRDTESETRRILSRAGLDLRWVVCRGAQQTGGAELCDAAGGPGRFTLRILTRYPGTQNQHGDPLGTAEIDAYYASLYAAETRRAAEEHGVSFAGLLACAAVHEVGHLLFGPAHSAAGIMRGAWDKAVYRDAAQRRLGFTTGAGR
jgi:hypothetical protein